MPIIIASKHRYVKNLFENLNKNVIFNNMKNANGLAKTILLFLVLIFAAANLPAQTFSIVHNFAPSEQSTNGINPSGDLILSNGTLYGIVAGGGNGYGSIFSVNTDGTGFNLIYNFSNSPSYNLALIGSALYATTYMGGINNNGTLCSVTTNGSNPKVTYQFQGITNGAFPLTMISANNILYGTTQFGNWGNPPGISGGGVLYSIDTNGNNFTILHTFDVNQGGFSLFLKDNTFFGTTAAQLTNAFIFSMDISGSNFTNLYSFTNGMAAINLTYDQGKLYGIGVSNANISFNSGIIFSMNINGSNFNVLQTFTNVPYCLAVLNNSIWGCTFSGGFYNGGTIFSMKTNGENYNVLFNFHQNNLGFASPSSLLVNGSSFFGTTELGGTNGEGTVFNFNSSPTLQTMIRSNGNFNMTWNAASNAIYQLQYSTNLLSTNWVSFGNNLTATTSNVVFSDSTTNAQRFYRLIYQP
jgi:uncharacterized repeat protein (TIGR03803 family)